jgi:hypothetical protein
MASPNLTETLTATLRNYSQEIADNVTNHNALLTWLSKGGSVKTCDGGATIDEQLQYQENSNGGSFSGLDILPTNQVEVFSAASFDWKEYAVPIMMSGREQGINSGKSRIFDLWKGRIENAKATMANHISEGLASDGTGNGSKDITGLQAAVPETTTSGTYGGIDSATWTFWRSQKVDTSATITTSTLPQAMNDLYVACTRGIFVPNLIIGGTSFYSILETTLMAIQRFTTEATAKYGFPTLKYKGADVVMDNNVSAYRAYFLNTKHLRWRPHKDYNMVPMDERSPVNQNAKGTILYFMGNLTTSVRRDQGLLIGD